MRQIPDEAGENLRAVTLSRRSTSRRFSARPSSKGFGEGEKAGSVAATTRFQDSVAAFGQAARELAALKPALRIEAETELVTLALTIARRIIRRELSVDRTTVRALVRSCCDEFQRAEIHRLRVNPNGHRGSLGLFRGQSGSDDPVAGRPLDFTRWRRIRVGSRRTRRAH